MPVSKHLPYNWHDTPNIHLCTTMDFEKMRRRKHQNHLKSRKYAPPNTGVNSPQFNGVRFYRLGNLVKTATYRAMTGLRHCWLLTAALSHAQQMQRFGDYELHYIVITRQPCSHLSLLGTEFARAKPCAIFPLSTPTARACLRYWRVPRRTYSASAKTFRFVK